MIGVTSTGPVNIVIGSVPTDAIISMVPRIFKPCSSANPREVSIIIAAPSVSGQLFPAVRYPFFLFTIPGSCWHFSTEVFGRGPSSVLAHSVSPGINWPVTSTIGSPFSLSFGTSMGIISLSRISFEWGLHAFICESTESWSNSSRNSSYELPIFLFHNFPISSAPAIWPAMFCPYSCDFWTI
jgi:hypothetical protein